MTQYAYLQAGITISAGLYASDLARAQLTARLMGDGTVVVNLSPDEVRYDLTHCSRSFGLGYQLDIESWVALNALSETWAKRSGLSPQDHAAHRLWWVGSTLDREGGRRRVSPFDPMP